MEDITDPDDNTWPNLGALFAEHLVKLKIKSFQTAGAKKETDGSLLTPIFMHCRIPLDGAAVDDQLVYMDAAHLTSAHWLKDGRFWTFRDTDGTHLIELPRRSVTDFSGGLGSIQFYSDPCLLRAPSTMPRRYTVQRAGGPQQEQPRPALPSFPPMLDMSTRPEGDFQRVVIVLSPPSRLEYRDADVRAERV